MRFHFIRQAWRGLARQPGHTFVVIAGLAVGLAAAYMLLGFVHYCLRYNAAIPEVERVFVVKQRYLADPKEPWFDQAPLLLRLAAERTPGVEAATAYLPSRPQDTGLTVRANGQLRRLDSLTVLPSFPSVLGLRALQGDLAGALAAPEGIVLTESAALRLFGSAAAVGRTLLADGKLLRVGAVVPTPPSNTTIPYDALMGVNSIVTPELKDEMLTGSQGWWAKLLLRVTPQAQPAAIAAALQRAIDTAPAVQKQPPEVRARLGQRPVMQIAVAPLRQAYFDREVAANFVTGAGDRGNPAIVAGLAALALLILVLATANYVNLAALRTARREREIAVRKVMGARRRSLAAQILAESMTTTLAATVIALALARLALPLFSQLVNRDLQLLATWPLMAAAVGVGLLLGAGAAVYPIWLAVRVRPARALAGRSGESGDTLTLRRTLTVLQIGAAMGLAAVALTVTAQARFEHDADPGFDPSALVVVDLPGTPQQGADARGFLAALAAHPDIAGVTRSADAVGRHLDAWFRDLKRSDIARTVGVDIKSVSPNFFQLYRIAPRAGRLFDPARDRAVDAVPLVLNAIAARELGFASPEDAVGRTLLFRGAENKLMAKTVIGIAPELRYHSLRERPHAVAYDLWPDSQTVTVRGRGAAARTEAIVESLWQRYFPNTLLRMARADAILAADSADDTRLANLLDIATLIALAIAGFGIHALAALSVQQRSREIVMRRLHGASSRDIAWLLARALGRDLLAAAAVGLPLAAVASARYLAQFPVHAPIGQWPLALALVLAALVAALAAAQHIRFALGLRPVEVLRSAA